MRQRASVLIVEDDDALRRMFRTALAFAGFDTREAADGYTALHLLDQFIPTAIVLDLGLPTVSGYVVLQDLAATAHTREIPVIVVTAMDVRESETAGAACLMHKPVAPDRLVDTVRACIAAGSASAASRGF